MTEMTSLLDKVTQGSYYYYCLWANGKTGSITDHHGNCIYRFYETGKDDNGHSYALHEKEEDNPIVAMGIVAYWLQNRKNTNRLTTLFSKSDKVALPIREQFDSYTNSRFNDFKNKNVNNPHTWNWDWEFEFYVKFIIPNELFLNDETEALFEYLTEEDVQTVRDVMTCYIEYLKERRKEVGYQMDVDFMVLRAIDKYNKYALEDLSDSEISETINRLEDGGFIKVGMLEGPNYEGVSLSNMGRRFLKRLESNMKKKITEVDVLKAEIFDLKCKIAELEAEKSGPNVDEEALRSHFKPIFLGEIRDHEDKIPYLIDIINKTEDDIAIGRLALQIYKSKFFLKTGFRAFTPWYREFCRIIGREPNKGYTKNRFETEDKGFLASVSFLHI